MVRVMETITGQIVQAASLPNSASGNPRWRVMFCDAYSGALSTLDTKSDAACNYDVDNMRRTGTVVECTLTRAGRIETIRPI